MTDRQRFRRKIGRRDLFPFPERKPCQDLLVPRTAADVILVDKFAVLRCVISAVGIAVFHIENPFDSACIHAVPLKHFRFHDKVKRFIRKFSADGKGAVAHRYIVGMVFRLIIRRIDKLKFVPQLRPVSVSQRIIHNLLAGDDIEILHLHAVHSHSAVA